MSARTTRSVERLPLADGESGYLLVTPTQPDGRSALIGHGFLSNPYHCLGLAEALAGHGITVGVVDYGEPLQGEPYEVPSDYKYRRLCMAIEAMEARAAAERWLVAVHSYGGIALKDLLEDAPVPIDEGHFISALGFGEPVKVLHPNRFPDVIRMYGAELFSAVARPRRILNPQALQAQIRSLRNRDARIAELQEIVSLPTNCALPAIRTAQKAGSLIVVSVAPHDNVVDPQRTSLAMEGEVRVIHPKANHFSPLTHGERVARVMLGLTDETPSAMPHAA